MSKAIWAVQNCKDRQTENLLKALRVEREPYLMVTLDRETGKLPPSFKGLGNNFIPYGSTALLTAAWGHWQHIFFNPETFNVETYNKKHPRMLNSDALIMSLSAAKILANRTNREWFIRPVDDSKSFAGERLTSAELTEWVAQLESNDCELKTDTLIALSAPKTISMEWRYFIVGGKIITGSVYRRNGVPLLQIELDQEVLAEAQALADMWLPYECCVMDTALYRGDLYVVEFNSLNSSGFYDHDLVALVRAVSQFCARTQSVLS